MARAIIRFSFQKKTPERTQLREGLEAADFTKIGTALYERSGNRLELVAALSDALARIAEADVDGFDHLWVYMDNTSE
jgi:hypothetical protein